MDTSVFYAAAPEQSSPSSVIATLECGQEVGVMSTPKEYGKYLTRTARMRYVGRACILTPPVRKQEMFANTGMKHRE